MGGLFAEHSPERVLRLRVGVSVVALTVALFPFISLPLEAESRVEGFVQRTWSFSDGLPVAGSTEVLQASDEMVWVATFGGLVRFDGSEITVFTSDRHPELGSDRIVDLEEDRDGRLWIRTEGGTVAVREHSRFRAIEPPLGSRATSLGRDTDGLAWIGTERGLWRADETGGLSPVEGLETFDVRTVLEDGRGRLWAGGADGLRRRGADRRWETLDLEEGQLGERVTALAEDDRGSVWVTTFEMVGRWVDPPAGESGVGALEVRVPAEGRLERDDLGRLWISTPERLLRWSEGRLDEVLRDDPGFVTLAVRTTEDGRTWVAWNRTLLVDEQPVSRAEGSDASVTDLELGRRGEVWATSSEAGSLSAWMPARIGAFGPDEGLPETGAYPVAEDPDGTLWTGGIGFVASRAPEADRFVDRGSPGDGRNRVTAILRTGDDVLLLGTMDGLWRHLDPGFERPDQPSRLRDAMVLGLVEDGYGRLWVGTDDGLFLRHGPDGEPRWLQWGEAEGVRAPVRAFLLDGDHLWMGTNGAGVLRLDVPPPGVENPAPPAVLDERAGLASRLVRDLWRDDDGNVWVATENRGLTRLTLDDRGAVFAAATLSRAEGLPSNGVHALVPDERGNLWMSSNDGIFRARLEDLEAVADGKRNAVDAVAYTERDGMLHREANGGVDAAGLRARDGSIWFPTRAGLVVARPGTSVSDSRPPRVRITDLHVAGRSLGSPREAVVLGPGEGRFTVSYAVPAFRAPERQAYRYRLWPYETEWVDAGGRRQAFYGSLPPGEYRFEVLATDGDGLWSPEPATIDFVLEPAFRETRAFQGLVLGVFGLAVVLVIRQRDRRQQRRREELERTIRERTATIRSQAEKLEELDRAKSRFFANVSHELRTPLTLTLGPLRDVLDGDLGPVGPEVTDHLEIVACNAERLLELVDQLLDIARLDAGRLELRWSREDLVERLREWVEATRPLAGRRDIGLVLRTERAALETSIDPEQLRKVVGNLLSNAVKYSPTGSSVTVELEAPAETGGDETLRIRVEDEGPGIPESERESIFERFHRIDEARRSATPGTGIGLSLARELVDLHGGSLRVEDGARGGSAFVVELPIRAPDASVAGGASSPIGSEGGGVSSGADGGRPSAGTGDAGAEAPSATEQADAGGDRDRTTVLVVDDHPEMRAYLRRHLARTYRVVEAADGREALERVRRSPPDLVVTDVMMPVMDGLELFAALRDDPDTSFVPVVLLTAQASRDRRIEGLRAGVDDYLTKPFDARELEARVGNLVEGRRRLRARLLAARTETALDRPTETEVPEGSADDRFLAKLRRVLDARHAEESLTVQELADAMVCDRTTLFRRLKSLTGDSPAATLRHFRLDRADRLLRAEAGTVCEVAYAVGFKSVSHFSRAFLERFGHRPSAVVPERGNPPKGGVADESPT